MLINQDLQIKIQKLIESFDCKLYDIATLKENDNQILRIFVTSKSRKIVVKPVIANENFFAK